MTADSSTVLSSHDSQIRILGVMLLVNDHLQGKALAAANREGEGETGRARRSASRQSLDPVQRLRTPDADARPRRLKSTALLSGKFYAQGKSSSKFVRKEDLNTVRRELKNYEVMKTLVDRWIEMATELSNLRMANKHT